MVKMMYKLIKMHKVHALLKKRFPSFDNVAIYDIIKEVEYALAECSNLQEAQEVMWQYLSLRPLQAIRYIKEDK